MYIGKFLLNAIKLFLTPYLEVKTEHFIKRLKFESFSFNYKPQHLKFPMNPQEQQMNHLKLAVPTRPRRWGMVLVNKNCSTLRL